MINIKKIFIFLLICTAFILNLKAGSQNKEKVIKQNYNKAKVQIIKKEWLKAIKLLEDITSSNWESGLKDNALYWLAYSLRKNAKNVEDREKQVEGLESAIERLNSLVEHFPSSNWVDDGKILRIEIAEELIKRGLSGYKKIIDKSSKEQSKENIKLYALDALLNMDDNKAFPLLKKMIYSNSSLKLKKKAIFVLSQQKDKRVLPLLAQISLSKNPFDLKEKAVFWIGQIDGKDGLYSLVRIYKKCTDEKIKDRVIFAIAQTGEHGIIELIKIYKLEKNIKLKKKILFWVGQSKSKAASDFLKEVLFE